MLEAKGKGTKASWARRDVYSLECHFLNWNKLPFDLADTLTAAYHDILATMHHDHNHSTTLPLTSTLHLPNTVPQPSALRLSHFAIIWLNLFPSAFPSLFLSVTYYIYICLWWIYLSISITNIIYYIYNICKRMLTDETQRIPAGWTQRGLSLREGPQNKFDLKNHGSCVQSGWLLRFMWLQKWKCLCIVRTLWNSCIIFLGLFILQWTILKR